MFRRWIKRDDCKQKGTCFPEAPLPAMPLDHSRTPAAPTSNIPRNLGLFILRVTVGGCLLVSHGWGGGIAAWSHIWHKSAWDLPGQLAILGFPLSLPLGIALIIFTLLGGLFLIFGLLTRTSALALALLASITAVLFRAYPGVAETAVLYAGTCGAIFLSGPGGLSLDYWLRAATKRRKA